jgi:acyl-CoA synthetase (AMP-forming)/AMP-acid ligase II
METEQHSMLALLQSQASLHTERLAHVLPDRDITYRRLWSRIERGSARLQGEWGVRPGDTVAYVGAGHPDAIVLYFSLLRIGASLLPLEGVAPAVVAVQCARHRVVLAVHDDGVDVHGVPARRLEDLLAVWCHYDPLIADDDATRRALWLPATDGQWQAISLTELCEDVPPEPTATAVGDKIFNLETLREVVLPSLRAAIQIRFVAPAAAWKTGS